MSDVRDALVSLLNDVAGALPADHADDDLLCLASIDVLVLHERIEDDLGVRIPASEVTPEAFETLSALVALVTRHAPSADRERGGAP